MSEYSDGSTYRQPLFTLTPEEVTVIEHFLSCDKDVLGMALPTWERDLMISDLNHILTRIKQWQDENRTDS